MFIVGDAHRCQVMLIVWVGLGLEFAGEVLYKTILNCPGGHWNLGWGRVQCVLAQFFDLENFDRISYVWLEDLCRIMCLGMMLLTFQLDQSVSTEAAGKQGIYITTWPKWRAASQHNFDPEVHSPIKKRKPSLTPPKGSKTEAWTLGDRQKNFNNFFKFYWNTLAYQVYNTVLLGIQFFSPINSVFFLSPCSPVSH